MFLKENADLWTIEDILNEDDERKNANKDSRAQKSMNDNDLLEKMMQLVVE